MLIKVELVAERVRMATSCSTLDHGGDVGIRVKVTCKRSDVKIWNCISRANPVSVQRVRSNVCAMRGRAWTTYLNRIISEVE